MGRKCKVLLRDSGRDCCLPAWQEHYSISGSRDLNWSPSILTMHTSLGMCYGNFDATRVLFLFFAFAFCLMKIKVTSP